MQVVWWAKWTLCFLLSLNCCWSAVDSLSQTTSCCFVELLTALRCSQIAGVYHFHLHYNHQCKHETILVHWGSWQRQLQEKQAGCHTQVPTQLQYLLLMPVLTVVKLFWAAAQYGHDNHWTHTRENNGRANFYWCPSILNYQCKCVSQIETNVVLSQLQLVTQT